MLSSSINRDAVRTRNLEDILSLQEEGHLLPVHSNRMGSAKSPNFSLGKPPNKSPSSENVTGSADEKSDLDQASRRTKYGWQSPRYAVEDGYSGEKLLANGGQSRHRKTTSHTRKVSISSGFAGLGSGRRVDAAAFLDGSSGTEDDDDGVKSTKKVEVHDRRAEVSAGLTGKDKHAFILLIVLCELFPCFI